MRSKAPRMTPKESKQGYYRAAVRSFGLCEVCGARQATQMHHRLHRSHGGNERPCNLLHVCLWCHQDAHQHSDRYTNGWAVRTGFDPGLTPLVYRGVLTILTEDGGLF